MNDYKLPSAFRAWIQNKWFEHKDEVLMWGGRPPEDAQAYFSKYKWWLKTVYKKEIADNERKKEDGKYT